METGGLSISAGWTDGQKEQKESWSRDVHDTIRTRTGDEAVAGWKTNSRGVSRTTLGRRTGISARGDAGCGEAAELELRIGMTRNCGVVVRR